MGRHCCLTSLSYSFEPMVPWMVCRFWCWLSSMACEACLMDVAIALSLVRGGRFSRDRFVIVLARRSTLSVGSLSGLDSRASFGQWLNCDRRRWVWEYARYPLSVSLFMLLRRCSIPIWVALSLMEWNPRPISFVGLWTPSVGKLCIMPIASRSDLLRSRSMSVSWRSVKTPRCVAWYLDLRSCSMTRVL